MGTLSAAGHAALSVLFVVAIAGVTRSSGAQTAAAPTTGTLVRAVLTGDELAVPQQVRFAIKMRNLEELDARVARGEILSLRDMRARYFPAPESWAAVAAWAKANGYSVENEDSTRMTVFTTSTVGQVQASLQVRFARRIGTDGAEYTSTADIPSLPPEIAGLVASVSGLRPDLRARAASGTVTNGGITCMLPQTVSGAYDTGALTGAGQTIVVVGSSAVNPADLIAFWANCGLPVTLAQFTEFDPYPASLGSNAQSAEETSDIEWSSGIAPGARILYISTVDPDRLLEILATLNDPTIHQVTCSWGLSEAYYARSGAQPGESQYFAALAALGITWFNASGDYGSSANTTGGTAYYDPSGQVAPFYPASDPYVTGVGGTTLGMASSAANDSYGTPLTEGGWCLPDPPISAVAGHEPDYDFAASTGGISLLFARPSWQEGSSLPSGSMRCSPDVAAISMGLPVAYGYFLGADTAFAGTSLSSPVWAAVCAMINEARANASLGPVGLLGPRVYPLMGSNSFHPITTGSASGLAFTSTANNGAYGVGAEYNMVCGLGSPDVGNLIAALVIAPVANGSSPITLTAPAAVGVTYQWYLDRVAIPGAQSATAVVYPTAANEGIYSVDETDGGSLSTTTVETLSVTTDAWLVNLSARAFVQTGANLLVAGFATTGTANKSLLVRGDGPALGGFGITDFLPDPHLAIFTGPTAIAATSSWAASLAATFAQVGAFSLIPGSLDTALLESLAPGSYTAQITSPTTKSGVALAEIYDADSGAPANRLVNLSARAFVGTGANILVGGFVIAGSTQQTVIIRADGPSLAGFGLSGALVSPVLTLTGGAGTIATNAGWGNASVNGAFAGGTTIQSLTAALSARVGAFALGASSSDSAIVATLPPGTYTAQVAGANGSTGIALLEIYELR
jgi:kumamolisin